MKYYCSELNKEFDSQSEMFKALKRNETRIISLKTSQVYKSAEKNQLSVIGSYLKEDIATKAGIEFEPGFVYPVINTTRYMDSHKDVHFDGIWKKTMKEQKGNIYYVDNHNLAVDDVIAWKEDVEVFTKLILWSLVGKDFPGETEALIYKIAKDKLVKQTAIEAINNKRPVENSVRMIYVKIMMAIDSNEKELKKNKEYFDKRYPEIANKEKVDEFGYFWGVEEAKIYKEGSMVLAGSNDATSIITVEDIEPSKDTLSDRQPSKDTVDYKFIKDNINLKI